MGEVKVTGKKAAVPPYAKQLKALVTAAEKSRKITISPSQTYTKILRVGRAHEGDRVTRVRLELKGQVRDIPLRTGVDGTAIFDALRTGGWCRVWLDLAWDRTKDGVSKLKEGRSSIVRAEPFLPLNGRDFLHAARPLFDVPPDADAVVSSDRGDA